MNVVTYPVGIESRVRNILHLLQTQRNDDIKMFGIFGMGGVGKTTLAKAIYNLSFQKFESCFIANIRSQVSKGHNGLVLLQKKLLCKTLNRKKLEIDNVDEGISLIKERLRSKSVLIVLDDINDTSQLELLAGQRNWFGSGSTIIITTRDVQLLNNLEAHEKYMVETLSPGESLQLLSWHAFGVPIPLEEYIELSKGIASYNDGLPLALNIIGSHLRGRSVQEWSDNAQKLRRTPNDKVQKILKIIYDSLYSDTKSIFLDIACFFIGDDENDTSIILEACGFYAKIGMKTLIPIELGKLRELPIELGKLEHLRDLLARGTAISHIPFSLGCLKNLKRLDLAEHKSCVLSKSKSKSQLLDILSPLFLSRTRDGVSFLPPSVANLCSLEVLYVSDNYLLHEVDLRIILENLTSLVSLDFSGSYYLQSLIMSSFKLEKSLFGEFAKS